MERLPRKIYTYEFKMEAVRLVESGQSVAEAARSLGVIEQTLSNLDQGAQVWQADGQRSRIEADRRADRDPPVTRGTGAGQDGARHPGKSGGILLAGPEMKYAHIYRSRHLWPVRVQCEVLEVSFTGYHQHHLRRKKLSSRRHMSDEGLLVHIRALHAELRGAYGWPRMWRELRRRGVRVGKERVRLLMRQHGIQARGRRRFRVATTDSNHKLPIAPNLLDRNFTVEKPNTTWTGDVTYIASEEGWLYLAVVIDLFSRRIVGWSMKTTIDRSLVIDALEMACLERRPEAGKAIFHSDRGSQYASDDYREVMKMYGLIASMSRRANCWDNAVTETPFGSLKVERLHGEKFVTVRAAKDAVINWILWYNRKRMHSRIGYQSPVEFEQAWRQVQREAA